MTALNFRGKLFLAMALLIAGVMAVTLAAVQNRIGASYESLFAYLFETQTKAVLNQRQVRLGPVKQWAAKAGRDPRLLALASEIAAADSPDSEDINNLYLTAMDQMQSFFEAAGKPRTGRARDIEETQGVCFFLNNRGEMLRPASNVTAAIDWQALESAAAPLRAAGQAVVATGTQRMGYVAVRERTDHMAVREMVLTPIIDRVKQITNGVLVISLPMPEDANQRQQAGGLWLPGYFFSSSVDGKDAGPLLNALDQHLRQGRVMRTNFPVFFHGVTYQVYGQGLDADTGFPPAYQVYLYSLANATEEIRRARWMMALVGLAAMLIALLLAFWISNQFSGPLREVAQATTEIERGNYNIKLPVRNRDETGRLAAAFNQMAEGLAQKEKVRAVLNLVADTQVAEELLAGRVALGGELRDISVLFCDIRGFTAMSQDRPPTEVIAMLNEHMTAMTRVVAECDGVVDKFVGDLVMALFGAPRASEHNAWNAARCALRMIEERERLNAQTGRAIPIGIGVATGQAVAGCMGSADRINYTVLGERVNLASRLCGHAGKMEVVIDETTRSRLNGTARVENLPPLKLKGFSGAIKAYQLKGLASVNIPVEAHVEK